MARFLILIGLAALALCAGVLASSRADPPRPVLTPLEPLRPWQANPRYFTDGSGRAVYLTGFHTWSNLVDRGPSLPPQPFDFGAYLDRLARDGDNLIRLWAWELPAYRNRLGTWYTDPQPWPRTGPGEARDGLPRFDLTRFDPRYFDRLRRRVAAAGRRRVYVSVMLFEGWEARFAQQPLGWLAHPFAHGNNVNGIAADEDGHGLGFFTTDDREVFALQRAYVRRVVRTVGRLPNVLFEISNEAPPDSTDWQRAMVRVVRQELARLGVRRPVGLTFEHDGSNETLYRSNADWVSPGGSVFASDPPLADPRKVTLLDSDHVCGVCGDERFVWESFTRGYNVLFMDDLADSPARARARVALGEARALADRLPLGRMEPRTDGCSTRYCLVAPGTDWVVFQPDAAPFTVELPRAERGYRFEWLEPAGSSFMRGRLRAGGTTAFTPPFAPAVLVLRAR